MQMSFVIAKNPKSESHLPYLLRLPLPEGDLMLATRGRFPADRDLFCYQLESWPEGAEEVEVVPIVHLARRGKSVELVLDRTRLRRSLFVWTQIRGRTLIFWRSERSMQSTRPGVRIPGARALDRGLVIAVDARERYGWQFTGKAVACERRHLPVGDYGVITDGRLAAVVERKSVPDLAQALQDGSLQLKLAELATVPHAALVVEGRLSELLRLGQERRVRDGWLVSIVAALQVQQPQVSWMFCEHRKIAEDFAFRFLSAALARQRELSTADDSPVGPDVPSMPPRLLDAPARRERLLEALASQSRITAREAAQLCGVTPATAGRDLLSLVEEGLAVAEGERRGRCYRLAPPVG